MVRLGTVDEELPAAIQIGAEMLQTSVGRTGTIVLDPGEDDLTVDTGFTTGGLLIALDSPARHYADERA